jgi:hypothetical protein
MASFELLFPDAVQKKPVYIKTDGEILNKRLCKRTVLFTDDVSTVYLRVGVMPGDWWEFQNPTEADISIIADKAAGGSDTFTLAAGEISMIRWDGEIWTFSNYDIFALSEYAKTTIENAAGWDNPTGENVVDASAEMTAAAEALDGRIAPLQNADTGIPKVQSDILALQNSTSGIPPVKTAASTLKTNVNALDEEVSELGGRAGTIQTIVDNAESSIGASGDGNAPEFREASARNLLSVLGVSTVADAFDELAGACNGAEVPNFSGLRIGDYIDLTAGLSGIADWNDTYKNLRLVIAGFNTYHNVGDTQNTKNHILFMFRHCPVQVKMNGTSSIVGGFPNASLKTYLDETFTPALITAIGGTDYIYQIKVAHSTKGSYSWQTYKLWVPTEVEVFGCQTFGDELNSYNTNLQFPIFQKSSEYRVKNYNGVPSFWWCSTPMASRDDACCGVGVDGGTASADPKLEGRGASPCFVISSI